MVSFTRAEGMKQTNEFLFKKKKKQKENDLQSLFLYNLCVLSELCFSHGCQHLYHTDCTFVLRVLFLGIYPFLKIFYSSTNLPNLKVVLKAISFKECIMELYFFPIEHRI